MTRSLTIDGFEISDDSDAWVIAEVGHNHQGDVEKCKELFRRAQAAGAHSVKLQKRDNCTLFTREAYQKPYDNENSFGATYGEHREFLEFNREQYAELQKFCRELKITFWATAFDFKSADFLAGLDMPAYKIASGDVTNTPLLKHVARIGRPMIVSTGTATLAEVRRVCETVLPLNRQLAVLQCTASYPNEFKEMNLRVIETFRREFPDVVIGASMHDSGIAMATAAFVLGARIIEKHFTLNRAMKGTDHAFSLEPEGMRKMCRDLARAREAMGDGIKRTFPTEEAPRKKMGKSLYAARSLKAGTVLTAADIAIKSPGGHTPPYELDRFVGRKLAKPVAEEEPLTPQHLDGA